MVKTKNPTSLRACHSETFIFDIAEDALAYDECFPLVTPDGTKVPLCPIQSIFPLYFDHNDPLKFVNLHFNVTAHGCYNYQGARIPLENGFNIPLWRSSLRGSEHYEICDFLQFGFPLGTDHSKEFEPSVKNHPSAYAYSKEIDAFVTKELKLGAIMGPLDGIPFNNFQMSPLMTADKDKGKARRVCFDLSFPELSVNAATPEKEFMGAPAFYNFPKIDEFEDMIVELGPGCLLWKSDLSRFFMQIPF